MSPPPKWEMVGGDDTSSTITSYDASVGRLTLQQTHTHTPQRRIIMSMSNLKKFFFGYNALSSVERYELTQRLVRDCNSAIHKVLKIVPSISAKKATAITCTLLLFLSKKLRRAAQRGKSIDAYFIREMFHLAQRYICRQHKVVPITSK